MKILCDRTALQEAVNVVSSVVPVKTPKPILQNILVRAEGDGITLFATDLEMAARVQLDSVKVSRKGSVLLPAKETSALLRELSDPTVTLESTDQRCRIESGGGSFVLLGEDPQQFPDETQVKSGKRLEIPSGRMLRMIQETVFAAAREETRYAINGVLVDAAAGCLRLVATDGRRLAISYENVDAKSEFKVVVPLRALNTLARALGEGSKEMLQIDVGDKQVVFHTGKMQLVSQLLETRFPDYEGVLPKAADTTVEIQKAVLESALRRASILCAAEMRMVRFEVGEQSLRMTAESSARGRADVVVDAAVKGSGGSINFNPDYILEALRVCQLDQVRLDMSDDSMPAKFTLGESFTYVVMPISGA
ncbi:MAG: DNA polymerase III subunit beta [Planctomycetes bacterium]|jgi:DNA polymerase-3 subunit beta|nr:DNA polymerase III subunit beta [Planctomycetota bacterium]